MTPSTQAIPVDTLDVGGVPEDAWERDDTPEPFYERLRRRPDAYQRYLDTLTEIREHQATLGEVRRAQAFTQATIAQLLDMDQSEVSRLERRSDMLLSTLRSFIRAAGGDLQLIVTFPDKPTAIELLIGLPGTPTPDRTSDMPHSERTSRKSASAASRTLQSESTSKAAKSAAGSALAQTGTQKTTSKSAAKAASRTLRSPSASKSSKTAAGSALTQRTSAGRRPMK